MNKKKVVIFGGGTGITQLLLGLKLFPIDITAVIAVSDNGSSTGKLRSEFSMPAMGDIRKVITSLSDVDKDIKNLLEYRFNTYSDLDGHPIGNLILVGMYNITGSLTKSIEALSKFLNIKNCVLPLSEDSLTLMGETYDGKVICGEEEITREKTKYRKLFYKGDVHVLPSVIDAIKNADMIIFSMGSLFTSILPHLLAFDVIDAIDSSNAKLVYTCNAMTQPGETDDYNVSDHIKILNSYLNRKKIDTVFASNTKIDKSILKKYETSEQKDLVKVDRKKIYNMGVHLITGDYIKIEDGKIRHDSLMIATSIFNELLR